jgi:hypothetical protein
MTADREHPYLEDRVPELGPDPVEDHVAEYDDGGISLSVADNETAPAASEEVRDIKVGDAGTSQEGT